MLGGPGLVTRFLPGRPILDPPFPPDLGRQMALTLAGIHAYPCDASAQAFLLDKDPEKLWWRRSGSIPAWMAADPDGRLIWEAFERLLPRQEKTPPRLCHTDFWSGNVLCQDGKITAVLDWGEAGYGDPAADVAYGYMDLVLTGLERQTRAPQEIILVDGGSRDASCDIIRQYIGRGAPIQLLVAPGANRSRGRRSTP